MTQAALLGGLLCVGSTNQGLGWFGKRGAKKWPEVSQQEQSHGQIK